MKQQRNEGVKEGKGHGPSLRPCFAQDGQSCLPHKDSCNLALATPHPEAAGFSTALPAPPPAQSTATGVASWRTGAGQRDLQNSPSPMGFPVCLTCHTDSQCRLQGLWPPGHPGCLQMLRSHCVAQPTCSRWAHPELTGTQAPEPGP